MNIVATYPYRNEQGDLLYEVVRLDPKNFRQRHPEPGAPGGWSWNLNGTRRVLYRLPEILAAHASDYVIVCEGEKDADALAELGFTATTLSGGARTGGLQAGDTEALEALRGRYVALCPDQGAKDMRYGGAGLAHAETLHAALAGIVERLCLVLLGGPKDAAAWVEARRSEGLEDRAIKRLFLGLLDEAPVLSLDDPPRAPPSVPVMFADLQPDEDDRPEIEKSAELADVVDACEAALVAAGGLYTRDTLLVAPIIANTLKGPETVRREPGAPVVVPVDEHMACERLARVARFWSWKRADGEWEKTWCRPDQQAARLLTKPRSLRFPELSLVVEMPVLLPDGSVLAEPGYHATSGVLYAPLPGVRVPPINPWPTPAEASAALDVLREPLAEFPWPTPHDEAAAIAAILGALARSAIEGPVPLAGISATAPGSGKGLLADVVSIIGTGRRPARMTIPKDRDGEALRKAILALAIAGDRVILLDNVSDPLGSDALASVISDMTVSDRLLGASRIVKATCSSVWIATGNQLRYRADMGRRVMPIEIDPRCEHPEERAFKHRDLRTWVMEHRGRLAAAGLTLLRAYLAAGSPAHGKAPIGTFEAWDKLIRGAVVHATDEDPTAGREKVREAGDTELATLKGALAQVHAAVASASWTVAEIIRRAQEAGSEDLRDALLAFSPGRGEGISSVSLGKRLAAAEGRLAGSLRFERLKLARGVVQWRVVGREPVSETGLFG